MSIYSLDYAKEILKTKGFEVHDPWDIVDGFEKLIADFCGSKYAIALDSCTNALFLSLKYNKKTDVYQATVLGSWDGGRYTFKNYATIDGQYARKYHHDYIGVGFFSIHA